MAKILCFSTEKMLYAVQDELLSEIKINAKSVEEISQRVQSLGAAVVYKGQVATNDDLPASDVAKVGDMYYVTANSGYSIWNGTTWDQIGGTLDLSNLVTKTEFEQLQLQLNSEVTRATQKDNALEEMINLVGTGVQEDLAKKQDVLVSGTSIKTINSLSLLGEGNISLKPDLTETQYLAVDSGITASKVKLYDYYTSSPSVTISITPYSSRFTVNEKRAYRIGYKLYVIYFKITVKTSMGTGSTFGAITVDGYSTPLSPTLLVGRGMSSGVYWSGSGTSGCMAAGSMSTNSIHDISGIVRMA